MSRVRSRAADYSNPEVFSGDVNLLAKNNNNDVVEILFIVAIVLALILSASYCVLTRTSWWADNFLALNEPDDSSKYGESRSVKEPDGVGICENHFVDGNMVKTGTMSETKKDQLIHGSEEDDNYVHFDTNAQFFSKSSSLSPDQTRHQVILAAQSSERVDSKLSSLSPYQTRDQVTLAAQSSERVDSKSSSLSPDQTRDQVIMVAQSSERLDTSELTERNKSSDILISSDCSVNSHYNFANSQELITRRCQYLEYWDTDEMIRGNRNSYVHTGSDCSINSQYKCVTLSTVQAVEVKKKQQLRSSRNEELSSEVPLEAKALKRRHEQKKLQNGQSLDFPPLVWEAFLENSDLSFFTAEPKAETGFLNAIGNAVSLAPFIRKNNRLLKNKVKPALATQDALEEEKYSLGFLITDSSSSASSVAKNDNAAVDVSSNLERRDSALLNSVSVDHSTLCDVSELSDASQLPLSQSSSLTESDSDAYSDTLDLILGKEENQPKSTNPSSLVSELSDAPQLLPYKSSFSTDSGSDKYSDTLDLILENEENEPEATNSADEILKDRQILQKSKNQQNSPYNIKKILSSEKSRRNSCDTIDSSSDKYSDTLDLILENEENEPESTNSVDEILKDRQILQKSKNQQNSIYNIKKILSPEKSRRSLCDTIDSILTAETIGRLSTYTIDEILEENETPRKSRERNVSPFKNDEISIGEGAESLSSYTIDAISDEKETPLKPSEKVYEMSQHLRRTHNSLYDAINEIKEDETMCTGSPSLVESDNSSSTKSDSLGYLNSGVDESVKTGVVWWGRASTKGQPVTTPVKPPPVQKDTAPSTFTEELKLRAQRKNAKQILTRRESTLLMAADRKILLESEDTLYCTSKTFSNDQMESMLNTPDEREIEDDALARLMKVREMR